MKKPEMAQAGARRNGCSGGPAQGGLKNRQVKLHASHG